MMDSATVQYRLNLPRVLHSVSPALSALHTARVVALHPETISLLQQSHCPKCGVYRFSGGHLVGPAARKKRKRKRAPSSRALQRTCHVCGFSTDIPSAPPDDPVPDRLRRTGTVTPVPRAKGKVKESSATAVPRPVCGTAVTACTAVPLLSGRLSHSKANQPKSSILRDMITHDRQREEGAKSRRKRNEYNGLAAFLKEL